jgi:hypothetical protein
MHSRLGLRVRGGEVARDRGKGKERRGRREKRETPEETKEGTYKVG